MQNNTFRVKVEFMRVKVVSVIAFARCRMERKEDESDEFLSSDENT